MPAPVVARLNTVVYGGFTVGSTSNYQLHGVTVTEQDYTTLTVAFQVFTNHDTVATFNTQCTALEAAFRKPNGNLVVTVNGNNWYNLSQSGNTGMLASPRIRKAGGGGDSNNSRVYDVSVKVMLPADETGKSGRQSSTATLTQDGSEALHLDVGAVYTALSSTAALAQAQSAFPTYTAALLSTAGGTWDEFAAITYAHDSDNKICRCKASYKQILAAQAQTATNHATLQGVWTEVTTDRVSVGADPGASSPMYKITVRYFCFVRSTVSTDLKTVYENTVRPHMVAIAESYSGESPMSAILERPGLRPQDNSISARMVFLAEGTSALIRADTNIAKIEKRPFALEPVLDGTEYSYDRHARPGFIGAAVATTVLMVGDKPTSVLGAFDAYDKAIEDLEKSKDGGRYWITEVQEPTHKVIEFDGLDGLTPSITMIVFKRAALLQYAKVRSRTGGPGGAGGALPFRTQPRRRGGGGFIR